MLYLLILYVWLRLSTYIKRIRRWWWWWWLWNAKAFWVRFWPMCRSI